MVPLWNPYVGTGLPLAFNWQSAVFSVPSLVGYLFPLRYAYSVGIFMTMFIAGTGAYVLGRVVGVRMLGALTMVSVFELSGAFVLWLGYPQAQDMAWGAWLLAGCLLIARGVRRVRAIALFSLATACAVYGGHPETFIVMMTSALLAFGLVLLLRAAPARTGLPGGPILTPSLDLLVALAVGLLLSAPLLLPGSQTLSQSIRSTTGGYSGLPAHDLLFLPFSSFDGAPAAGDFAFGGSYFYNETAAYVGVIALGTRVGGNPVRGAAPAARSLGPDRGRGLGGCGPVRPTALPPGRSSPTRPSDQLASGVDALVLGRCRAGGRRGGRLPGSAQPARRAAVAPRCVHICCGRDRRVVVLRAGRRAPDPGYGTGAPPEGTELHPSDGLHGDRTCCRRAAPLATRLARGRPDGTPRSGDRVPPRRRFQSDRIQPRRLPGNDGGPPTQEHRG